MAYILNDSRDAESQTGRWRVHVAWLVAGIVVPAALAFGAVRVVRAQQVQLPPRPENHLVIDVPATEPWTDTGIAVRAGDRIQLRAWGAVRFDGGKTGTLVPPTGVKGEGGGCSFVITDAAVPAYALVANVSPQPTLDGHGFLVGAQWSGTSPVRGATAGAGNLYLGFNDEAVMCDRTGYDSWGFRNDNYGAFTVEVSVTRAH